MFLFKQKKTGIYYLYYNDNSGKRKKVTTKTKIKPEAMKFLKNFNVNQNKTVKNNFNVLTVSDLQKEVMKYVYSNFRKSTSELYRITFNEFLRVIGNKPIKLINSSDIEHYKSVRNTEVLPATVNIRLTTLKAIFNIAIRFEWISENPVNKIKKLSVPERERLSFSNEEFLLVINQITDLSIKNFVLFAYYTGCRINEICNIQIRDVNLSDRTVTIRNKPDFKTKTGRERVIPIDNGLFELLSGMLREGNVINYFNPEMYLFRNSKGFKYDKILVTKKFKQATRRAGLPERYHFHCLRHTRITEWVKMGLPIPIIMKLAGHSQSVTTENYTHITLSDIQKALNNF
jgi:integrase